MHRRNPGGLPAPSRPKRPRLAAATFLLGALALLSLTGCVYFNTFYNARKAYEQAMRLKYKRLAANPEDTVVASSEEKLKLERSIAKSSKVLELYAKEKKYLPKALFLIGESYLEMGKYAEAVRKYDELIQYYPRSEEIPTARFHRAKALFLDGQFAFAKAALEAFITSDADPAWRREALGYLAELEADNDSPRAALELYERLLREKGHPERARGNIRLEAARLAFDIEEWQMARSHALAGEIRSLADPLPLRSALLAAECLYRMGKYRQAADELEALLKEKRNRPYRPEIQLPLARARRADGDTELALSLWTEVGESSPKTAYAAEAFFLLGEHYLKEVHDEAKAKAFFDSSAAAGDFPHARKAKERAAALERLAQLRADSSAADRGAEYRDFMIAELFLFRLDEVDSALRRLDRIVEGRIADSVFGIRAAYARAFIQDEFKHSENAADSLYRYVLEKYPGTEYAKQAERNLGLKPTVQTDEDKAHSLFLEAEKQRFEGGDVLQVVIPAYRRVVEAYPHTRKAAQAQFNIAMLYEEAHASPDYAGALLDSAKQAYLALRDSWSGTPYAGLARAKLEAAGVFKDAAAASAGAADTARRPDSLAGDGRSHGRESYDEEEYEDDYERESSEPEWQANPKEVLENAPGDY